MLPVSSTLGIHDQIQMNSHEFLDNSIKVEFYFISDTFICVYKWDYCHVTFLGAHCNKHLRIRAIFNLSHRINYKISSLFSLVCHSPPSIAPLYNQNKLLKTQVSSYPFLNLQWLSIPFKRQFNVLGWSMRLWNIWNVPHPLLLWGLQMHSPQDFHPLFQLNFTELLLNVTDTYH